MRANVHPSTISRVANNDPGLRIAAATRSADRGTAPRDGLPAQRDRARAEAAPDQGARRGHPGHHQPVLRGALPRSRGRRGTPRVQRPALQHRRASGAAAISSAEPPGSPGRRGDRREQLPQGSERPRAAQAEGSVRPGQPFQRRGRGSVRRLGRSPRRPARHRAPDRARAHADRAPGGQIDGQHRHAAPARLPGCPQRCRPRRRIRDLIVEAGYTEESGAAAARRLLSLPEPPTAVFAVTDMVAIGAAEVARQMGLRIPEDLAIVGYNDIPLASRVSPGLTTMHVPIHEFGSVAVRLLLEQLESDEPARPSGAVHARSDRPRVHRRRRGETRVALARPSISAE